VEGSPEAGDIYDILKNTQILAESDLKKSKESLSEGVPMQRVSSSAAHQ